MIRINDDLIKDVIPEARSNKRLRKNFNFHPSASDPMHRMIHVSNIGTYVQPHKHENPDKTEAFIILKGKILLVEFDEEGSIIDHFIMQANTSNYGVEFVPKTWHMLITLENDSVFYEVKNGPWNPEDDKHFASWAPSEGDSDCAEYLKNILHRLNIE